MIVALLPGVSIPHCNRTIDPIPPHKVAIWETDFTDFTSGSVDRARIRASAVFILGLYVSLFCINKCDAGLK
jgi:hypothetical protein